MTSTATPEALFAAQRQFKATRQFCICEPLSLDDLTFQVDERCRSERALCEGEHVGDVLLDDTGQWFARKLNPATGEMGEWRTMRRASEARAFIVSRVRQ